MSQRENKGALFFEGVFFLLMLLFAIRQVENYDFWFHIKYGEYIWQTRSLPFTDTFSHTAFGKPAVPYEWLFQFFFFLIYKVAGVVGIQITVVALTLSYFFLFRQILLKIFAVPIIPRIIFTAGLYTIGYNFWVERPQLAAFLLFMAILFLVLKRVFIGKVSLWITPILFLIWTNLHASMIIGLYLFFSFAAVLWIRFLVRKVPDDMAKAKDLFLFGILNTFMTILPPLNTRVYKLLYLFYEKKDFITKAIDEWVPLAELSVRYYLYLVIFFLVALSLVFAFFKNKERRGEMLLFLPFIPLGLFVISGVRQTPFAMPAVFFLFVPAIRLIKRKLSPTIKSAFLVIIILLSIWGMSAYRKITVGIVKDTPSSYVLSFIQNNLQGNMFNEFHIGGYYMYHLGPKIKTFIDGRTDMFLPEVLPEYISFSNLVYTNDDYYLKSFEKLVAKYQISYAALTNNRYTLSSRLSRILENTPGWSLVFFDDTARIYVNKKGIDGIVATNFALPALTPFSKKIYRLESRREAFTQYQKMNERAKSAVATNALGYMLLEDGKYNEAKELFQQALMINPTAAAPKMNLAELSAKDGDYQKAISLYRQAIANESDRGLAYLRLGQLIVTSGGSKEKARQIWKKGLKATPDEEIIAKIEDELVNIK